MFDIVIPSEKLKIIFDPLLIVSQGNILVVTFPAIVIQSITGEKRSPF